MSASRPLPTVDAARYAQIERGFAELLAAPNLFVLQGEAMIALEAVARSIGRPGSRALNIVTGPYGEGFGAWLTQQGVAVRNLAVPFNRAASPDEVEEALSGAERFDLLSVVHAEAATGVVNDLAAIAALARRFGALTIVDAVASVGAEPLDIEAWGLDVTVVSAQKALGGPAGVTGVSVSEAAWAAMVDNETAPRDSVLSLLDWRQRWLESDRTSLPAIPNHLETLALEVAVADVAAEGLSRVIARHAHARDACRRGVHALGLRAWVETDVEAAAVATTVAVPEGLSVQDLVTAARDSVEDKFLPALGPAPGPLSNVAMRVGHTGVRATTEDVLAVVVALGRGLLSLGMECDVEAATAAVRNKT
jgi:aspartate aminotransferase-like enzyme